ncbi:MAG TPA: glycosyltransferase family 2 protein [Terriglobales bacterium]|nr:glycosyltransferase family 2 protein [Terriglobales bacterium]
MQPSTEFQHSDGNIASGLQSSAQKIDGTVLPVSVIVPARNEAQNIRRCLKSLQGVGEVYVIDSHSTDDTGAIAESLGAQVVQFHYEGSWPKKRQWALDELPLKFDWVLLLDADESLTPELSFEIRRAINNLSADGYYIGLDLFFLGRRLRYSGATFYKLCLFRRGKGHFERRTMERDASACDMEVHEHVIVNGPTRRLEQRIVHNNVENLARYIQKHNEYSDWEAQVWSEPDNDQTELQPKFFGSQAQRRRWLRKKFFLLPGSPLLFFLYKYIFRFGFLDGVPGLIYCSFQGTQFFHIKAKLYESRVHRDELLATKTNPAEGMEECHVRH